MASSRATPPFLVGLDVGTQSTRALLFDVRGRLVGSAAAPTPTLRPAPGRAEHVPAELWRTTREVLARLLRDLPGGPGGYPVAGLAVASVGEACVLLDERDEPLGNVIAWYDRRTEGIAARLPRTLPAGLLFGLTGLAAAPSYTLCKLLWLREHEPAAFARARRVLNVADWIAFQLSGEAATDLSLASRTLLLDLGARRWSPEILAASGLPADLLPPIRPNGAPLGPLRRSVAAELGLPARGAPVVGVGGHDHLLGAVAAGACRPGTLLDSLGTAEALFLMTDRALLTPEVARWEYAQGAIAAGGMCHYVGSGIACAGGAVEWFRSAVAPGAGHDALIAGARRVPAGSDGVLFLPHLAYSGPPRADVAARGAFVGLTAAAGRDQLFRALLEGLALEGRLAVDHLAALAPEAAPLRGLRVIGGVTRNALLLQLKADVYGRPLTVIDEPEATSLGAALLGGLAAGVWPSPDEALAGLEPRTHVVDPDPGLVPFYDELFQRAYAPLYDALRPVNRAIGALPAPPPSSSSSPLPSPAPALPAAAAAAAA